MRCRRALAPSRRGERGALRVGGLEGSGEHRGRSAVHRILNSAGWGVDGHGDGGDMRGLGQRLRDGERRCAVLDAYSRPEALGDVVH